MFNRHFRTFLAAVCVCFMVIEAQAQDPHYTQFYANQQYLNPALAGAGAGPRVSMNYRAQWVNIPGSYRQFAAGYDQPLYFGRSVQGVGLLVHSDKAGEGNLSKTDVYANYSFAIQMGGYKKKHYLRMGIGAGFQQASIDFSRLRFSDQIDSEEGFIYATQEVLQRSGRFSPDVNAGLAWYNDIAWVSASAHHITQPDNQWFVGTPPSGVDTRWPMRLTFTGGVSLPVGPMNEPDKVVVSPSMIFMQQRRFNQLNLGTYVTIKPIVLGVWYRSNFNNFENAFIQSDMVAGLVGFKEGIFSVGYSYDYTLSKLGNSISGGSHEIALVLEFESEKKSRFIHRKLPCPRF